MRSALSTVADYEPLHVGDSPSLEAPKLEALMTRNRPARSIFQGLKGRRLALPLLLLALSCDKEGSDISQQGCLQQADQDYAECDEACAEDATCTDECTDSWCTEVDACGVGESPGACSGDTSA